MRLVSETLAVLIVVSAVVVISLIASAVLSGIVATSKPREKGFTIYRADVDVAPAPTRTGAGSWACTLPSRLSRLLAI